MKRTLIPDDTLEQYQERLSCNPESIRPKQCPYCYKADLWSHGFYLRNHDINSHAQQGRNPIRILRFQVSSLPQNVFMPAYIPCSKALVFMEATAGRFIAGSQWSLCELSQ